MPDKSFRETLGEVYLALASILPDTEEGTIGILQTIEKHRQKDAKAAFERTKPPEDLDFQLLSIRMIELFTIDSLDSLVAEIPSYFPHISDPFRSRRFDELLSRYSDRLMGTSWVNVGTLLGSHKAGYFGSNSSVLEGLPPEVRFVRVGLIQFLPSYFALTLDAYLTKDATDKLLSIRNTMPKPRVKFKQLIPHGNMAFSHASSMADHEVTRLQKEYLSKIRHNTLSVINDLLTFGFFYSSGKELPFVEIFQMDGLPREMDSLEEWISENFYWLTNFGFNFVAYSYFIGDQLIYCRKDRTGRGNFNANRMILRKRNFAESEEIEDAEIPVGLVISRMDQFHRSLDGAWMILNFLEIAESRIAQFRRQASSLQVLSPRSPFHIYRVFRLHGEIVRTGSIFERLKLEYDQLKQWIQNDLANLDELQNPRLVRKGEPSTLGVVLPDTIEYQLQVLGEHIQITLESFSRYLSLLNTAAIYWFTLIAIGIGLITLFQSIEISEALRWLVMSIENVIASSVN